VLIKTHILYFAAWVGGVIMMISPLSFVLAFLLFLASTLASCLQRSWYAGLCDLSVFEHSCFNRTYLPLELRFIAAFFNLSHSCRCLWWDHASS
jgi:hypothetical protein